jgi:TRAP-type C4-dicarboxylate transport system substrate-binding protein
MKMNEYTDEQRKIVLNAMEEVEGGKNRKLQIRELTTEESEKLKSNINLKNVNTEPAISQKVNQISTQNIDSKRQASRNNVVVVQQNNNTTVVNQRTVARPVSPQTNNNPGLRQ